MRVLVGASVCALLLYAATGSVGPVVAAQGVLPDAPGREVTLKVCGNCHGADTLASVRLTPDDWREVITRMVAAGAKGTDRELDTVLQYVSTQFPVEGQKALDLNTARSVELEAVAGLLRKESAALIAHRQKNGPCKSLQDLKAVAGLDYRKIEARKARLACM
jgi:competence protein ComEA